MAGLYLVCYSIGRFILEFYRGDLERGSVGIFSTSQFISLFLVVAGAVIFFAAPKMKGAFGGLGVTTDAKAENMQAED